MADRAIVFIDGNNWFHSLRAAGIHDRLRLDYAKISRKLLGNRLWLGTKYYIGRVSQTSRPRAYADQRRFLASLVRTDSRISVRLGRLETRIVENAAAKELKRFLGQLSVRTDTTTYQALLRLADKHAKVEVQVEKAVDVVLAVDMIELATGDTYDAAYLLSADGDFTPAVEAVRRYGKKLYAVCPRPSYGAQLATAANAFIRLDRRWFTECYQS